MTVLTLSLLLSWSSVLTADMLPDCPAICQGQISNTHCYGGACLWQGPSYNKWQVPQDTGGSDSGLEVNTAIRVKSVSNINMEANTLEISMNLKLTWLDPGVLVCQCHHNNNRNRIKIGRNLEDFIWLPDLSIQDAWSYVSEAGLSKQSGTHLTHHPQHTEVLLFIKMTTVLSCTYVTRLYPFDRNVCMFRIQSQMDPSSRLNLTLSRLPVSNLSSHNTGLNLDILPLKPRDKEFNPRGQFVEPGSYHGVGFWLGIHRQTSIVVSQYMVVMSLMLVMSSVSSLLPANSKLGPVSVVMVGALTVYNDVHLNLPRPASGVTALICYIGGIIVLILLTIVNFIFSLLYTKFWGLSDSYMKKWNFFFFMSNTCLASAFTGLIFIFVHFHEAHQCPDAAKICPENSIECECFHNLSY